MTQEIDVFWIVLKVKYLPSTLASSSRCHLGRALRQDGLKPHEETWKHCAQHHQTRAFQEKVTSRIERTSNASTSIDLKILLRSIWESEW